MPKMTNLQFAGTDPLDEEQKPDGKKLDEKQQEGNAAELEAAAKEVEDEARLYGWVPKEDFKGKPEDWSDAESFVKRGKEINPILRKNNERLIKSLKKSEAEIAELKLTQKEFGEMYKKMSQNAYDRAIKDVKEQIKTARKDDPDLVDELEEQRDKLVEEAKNIKVPGTEGETKAPKGSAEGARLFEQWQEDNPWYNEETNPDLYYAAEGVARKLAATDEGKAMAGKQVFLDEVTKRTKALLPDRFKNKRRQEGSPVGTSGSSRSGGNGGGKKTYADLPADAKAACDRQIKAIPGFTKEKYVQYFEEAGGFNA